MRIYGRGRSPRPSEARRHSATQQQLGAPDNLVGRGKTREQGDGESEAGRDPEGEGPSKRRRTTMRKQFLSALGHGPAG
jgi:hypothetical protein